jgi:WD40 repeat protein
MSPEQAEGDLERVGPTSDIYSLGATLYCLLTGSPPIEETEVGAALRRAQRGEFPPPRVVNPRVPRALEAMCLRAMALRPEERYASPRALADDLEHWLADEPAAVYREPLTTRLRRWGRRHSTAAVGIGVLLVTALAALSISTVLISSEQARTRQQFIRAEANLAAAQEQRQRADDKAREATARAEELALQDYINRVNRAYHEVMVDNVALAQDLLLGCPPERRGLEWRYVMRLCHLERLTLEASGQGINAVDYSPDGMWIALGSGRFIIGGPKTDTDEIHVEICEAATGRRRQTISDLKGCVYSVAFSPDGTHVLVGTGFEVPATEARLTVWDAATGHLDWEWTWKGAEGFPGVMSIAFSPDGKSLAVGLGGYSWDSAGQITLLDVEARKKVKSFPAPVGGVNQLAFHPGGNRLAVAGKEIVEIWDVGHRDSPKKIHTLRGHRNWVYSVAFSPDGKWLATGGWDRTIKLWNAESYDEERPTIFGHTGFVYDLVFSPDSLSLASAGEDRKLALWEIPTGRNLATFHGHADIVHAIAFRPDGLEIATASVDGTVKIWDRKTGHPIVFSQHDRPVSRLAYHRNGQRVLSGSESFDPPGAYSTRGWDPITGETDPKLARDELLDGSNLPPDYEMGALSLENSLSKSSDGKLIAQIITGSWTSSYSDSRSYAGGTVEIWDAPSGDLIHTLIGHTCRVNCMLFSPDGKRLATASNDFTIKLWDVGNGHEVFTLRGHTAAVISLVFSPDGNRLVSGGYEGEARVWDATPLREGLLQELQSRYQQKGPHRLSFPGSSQSRTAGSVRSLPSLPRANDRRQMPSPRPAD